MWQSYRILLVFMLGVTGIVAQTSTVSPAAQLATKYSGSVFKLFVYTTEGIYPEEGTCFVIHQVGPTDNPTLYLMTAAHVLLGPEADDDTNLAKIKKIQIDYSNNGHWEITNDNGELKGGSIFVPPKGVRHHDFALLQVVQAGRPAKTLPIAGQDPKVNDSFTVFGFEGESSIGTPINGTIQSEAGVSEEPWFLANVDISEGNSGGPAFADSGVFALVEGRFKPKGAVMTLVPISLTAHFLEDNIPGFKFGPTTGDIVKREVSKVLRVDCLQTKEDSVDLHVRVRKGEELQSASASFEQTHNLKSYSIKAVNIEGNVVTVDYILVGPGIKMFGCKDEGSATLKVTAQVRHY